MIQGNRNPMDKALFALILHTLQETESEEVERRDNEKSESENIHLDQEDTYSFAEI